MAKKGPRVFVRMWNPTTGTHYLTTKNKLNTPEGLELMKYDKKTGKKEKFVEYKKKLH